VQHIDIDQIFSIPAIHMRKMSRVKPLLQTPQRMIDEWRDSFRNHPNGVPDIEFIHALRDLKSYFDKDVLDSLLAGYAGTRKKSAAKRVNKNARTSILAATAGDEEAAEEDSAHDNLETTEVTQNGKTVTIPTPHIFRFTRHPEKGTPIMHYKILSTDDKWLPAKKDGSGDVIFTTDSEGKAHWDTDPNGIDLVLNWPAADAEVPWASMQEQWKPHTNMREPGNPLKQVIGAVKRCEDHGADYDWLDSHSLFWDNWKTSVLEVQLDVEKVHLKEPYHIDFDKATGRPPPWQLPTPQEDTSHQQATVDTTSAQVDVEPITYRVDDTTTYTKANRAKVHCCCKHMSPHHRLPALLEGVCLCAAGSQTS
jgi:hypothetical protein